MELVFAREWDCPFNWKVLTENFMESYHHAGAHSQTLQPMMPARDTWTEREKAHYIRCHLPMKAALREKIETMESRGERWDSFPPIPEVTGEDRYEWGLCIGYPGFKFVVTADSLIWYRTHPLGPNRLRLTTTMLVPKSTVRHPDFPAMLEKGAAQAVAFHLEDMEVCMAVQRGYYSSGYQRGRLSHLEMPIWLIQRYLAARARGTWPGMDREPAGSQRSDLEGGA
jgi:phenylpropionate dioxygenase-like ring-hydroxylating dioxygenase large terminal subunit